MPNCSRVCRPNPRGCRLEVGVRRCCCRFEVVGAVAGVVGSVLWWASLCSVASRWLCSVVGFSMLGGYWVAGQSYGSHIHRLISQCVVHIVLVWLEYRRRSLRRKESGSRELEGGEFTGGRFDLDGNDSDGDDDGGVGMFGSSAMSSFAKRCESVNTMASFLW
ncbi:hypothetical protein Cgig2_021290 [Carnegiea gigantea]|uniref:Transmembrane protein n=1 Tax=Carnegiea gigantea TaxID=171969 RepID=A0A9Q1JLV5_9CARY|nr:hypothetical protein Cgig2_021290 [Carnegiea gigantea]